jgi:hypothetical protein
MIKKIVCKWSNVEPIIFDINDLEKGSVLMTMLEDIADSFEGDIAEIDIPENAPGNNPVCWLIINDPVLRDIIERMKANIINKPDLPEPGEDLATISKTRHDAKKIDIALFLEACAHLRSRYVLGHPREEVIHLFEQIIDLCEYLGCKNFSYIAKLLSFYVNQKYRLDYVYRRDNLALCEGICRGEIPMEEAFAIPKEQFEQISKNQYFARRIE